jgi:hypothetical protein
MSTTPKRVRGTDPQSGPYVVQRDTPLRAGGPAPIWITALGREVVDGSTTANLATARRWVDRPAAWRWLKRRQRPELGEPTLDLKWFMRNLAAGRRHSDAAAAAPH